MGWDLLIKVSKLISHTSLVALAFFCNCRSLLRRFAKHGVTSVSGSQLPRLPRPTDPRLPFPPLFSSSSDGEGGRGESTWMGDEGKAERSSSKVLGEGGREDSHGGGDGMGDNSLVREGGESRGGGDGMGDKSLVGEGGRGEVSCRGEDGIGDKSLVGDGGSGEESRGGGDGIGDKSLVGEGRGEESRGGEDGIGDKSLVGDGGSGEESCGRSLVGD